MRTVRVTRTNQHSPAGHALRKISIAQGSTADPALRMTQDVGSSRPATGVPAPVEIQVAPVYPEFGLSLESYQQLRRRAPG
jgi:hypothetical protein